MAQTARTTVALILSLCAPLGCAKKAEDAAPKERGAAEPSAAEPSAAIASVAPAGSAAPAPGSTVAAVDSARPARPARPLNVLFLTVDSLRADMPWAGYPRPIAPNLTKLAAESIVYENQRSVSSYTAQSVATWLSGRYASTLYREGTFFTAYSQVNDFIPEALQAKGIRTLGVQAHAYFGRDKGLNQGFDSWEVVKGVTFDATTDKNVTSQKSAERVIELLSDPKNTQGQFFLWSHFMDPHDEYKKHPESPDFGNKNRDRYDSEVWYTDSWLGKVFDFARTQPWWDHTAVIITADHGESFGEHGMYKHAFELWENLVRVPLIIRAPGAAPRRISEGRTHIDLAPTIMDLMGQPALAGFQGQSLVPELYGAEPKPREALALELAEDTNNPARRAIVHGDYKLIVFGAGGPKKLFNVKDDPAEENDLSKKEPAKLAEMSALLDKAFAEIPSIEPYGGAKLSSGKMANGPRGPSKPSSASTKP